MPRYFFHTLDGACVRDEQGEAFDDDAAARAEALLIFGELLRHSATWFWNSQTFSLILTNDAGELVTVLTATASRELPPDDRAIHLVAEIGQA